MYIFIYMFQTINMKNFRFVLLFVCLITTLTCLGCGSKELPSALIVRDEARTGGSISFVFNQEQRTVYVGGKNEIIQYSSKDESRNLEEGWRIGLKVIAPNESLDVSDATLKMNGLNYSAGDFLENINGQKQRFFYLFPFVSEENREVKFAVTWQNGTKEQEYKVVIVKGTKFLNKDGQIEQSK